MARYLQVAADANEAAKALVALVPEELRPAVAEHAARLVNFGLRCAPRAVQHTVRLRAVQAAVKGLPVTVRMEQKQGDRGTYNALITTPVYPTGVAVADVTDEELAA